MRSLGICGTKPKISISTDFQVVVLWGSCNQTWLIAADSVYMICFVQLQAMSERKMFPTYTLIYAADQPWTIHKPYIKQDNAYISQKKKTIYTFITRVNHADGPVTLVNVPWVPHYSVYKIKPSPAVRSIDYFLFFTP